MTFAVLSSSSAITEITFAGLNAFSISSAELGFQLMISIFSPLSSLTMALTLAPLIPTQAPTGSTSGLADQTAILVRLPASLAMLLIDLY